MAYRIIKNVKWYYRLKEKREGGKSIKGLFSDYPRESLLGKLIISWSYFDYETNKLFRLYSLFKTYIDFARYCLKLPQHMRCFYEVIIGEFIQKPHFDLDLDLEENNLSEEQVKEIFNNLINSIVDEFKNKSLELDLSRDVCVYSSHGKTKRSYHIVINNFCHANNHEAKAFYYCIMEKLPPEYVKNGWVDDSVYSLSQQFRCLGSQKFEKNRIKKLVEEWSFNDEIIKHKYIEEPEDENHLFLIQLEESLVGARTSTCKILPSYETPKEYKETTFESTETLDYVKTKQILDIFAASVGLKWGDSRIPYKFDKVEGPFIILKRTKPSKCKICYRIHEHQNPYLLLTPSGDIYFHCRRAPKEKKLYIGSIIEKVEEEYKPVKNKYRQLNKLQLNKRSFDLEKLDQIASTSSGKKVNLPKYYIKDPDKKQTQLLLDKIRDKF